MTKADIIVALASLPDAAHIYFEAPDHQDAGDLCLVGRIEIIEDQGERDPAFAVLHRGER